MAEGENFLRAVAVLAQGGEETFQSKKGAKEVEKVLLLLLSSLFEIWRGLSDMIWPNFYSSEQFLSRPVPMCEVAGVTPISKSGKNWTRNIKNNLKRNFLSHYPWLKFVSYIIVLVSIGDHK